MFKLQIETDNDAFQPNPAFELVSVLHTIADDIEAGNTSGKIRDTNGNTVGEWKLSV